MLMKNPAIESSFLILVWLKGAQNAWVQTTAETKWMWSFHFAAGPKPWPRCRRQDSYDLSFFLKKGTNIHPLSRYFLEGRRFLTIKYQAYCIRKTSWGQQKCAEIYLCLGMKFCPRRHKVPHNALKREALSCREQRGWTEAKARKWRFVSQICFAPESEGSRALRAGEAWQREAQIRRVRKYGKPPTFMFYIEFSTRSTTKKY